MRVLIVEAGDDGPGFMAGAFKEVIKAQGHYVTCLKGFEKVDPLIGLGSRSRRTLITQRFDIALVDYLDQPVDGPAATRALTERGVACIGTSALAEQNLELLAAGATLAMCKGTLLAALYTGKLQVEVACSPTRQDLIELTRFAATFKRDCRLRKALGSVVNAYLLRQEKAVA